MLRYCLQRYVKPILVTVAIAAPFQALAVLAQDFRVAPWVLPFINRTMVVWGFLPVLILSFGVGMHFSREPGELNREGSGRRAWNLGMTVILFPALASAGFALLHFYFGLTYGVLTETQGNVVAIGIVLGVILSLWVGAILSWLGYLAGRIIRPERGSSTN